MRRRYVAAALALAAVNGALLYWTARSMAATARPGCPVASRVIRPAAVSGPLSGHLFVSQPGEHWTRRNLAEIRLMPAAIWPRLFAAGLRRVYLGASPMPCFPGEAKAATKRPRGWGGAWTWMDVGGTYDDDQQVVVAGHGRNDGGASLSLHETGHAIGRLLGYDDSPVLREFQRRLYPKLPQYFQQGGPGGAVGSHELFAEGIASYLAYGQRDLAGWTSPAFKRWIGRVLHGAA